MMLPTELPVEDSTVLLREAVVEDVSAIVELLAADQLGVNRDGADSEAECALT